jgi:hypothetical protein
VYKQEWDDGHFIILLIWVNDHNIVVSNFLQLVINLKLLFHHEFEMFDDGKFNYLLCMQIIYNPKVGW